MRNLILAAVLLAMAGCAGERWTKTVRYVFVDVEGAAVEHQWTVETPHRPDDWLQLFSIHNRVEQRTHATRVTP